MATNFTFGDSFLNAYIGAQQRAQQQKQFDDEMNYRREQAKTAVEQFNKKFMQDTTYQNAMLEKTQTQIDNAQKNFNTNTKITLDGMYSTNPIDGYKGTGIDANTIETQYGLGSDYWADGIMLYNRADMKDWLNKRNIDAQITRINNAIQAGAKPPTAGQVLAGRKQGLQWNTEAGTWEPIPEAKLPSQFMNIELPKDLITNSNFDLVGQVRKDTGLSGSDLLKAVQKIQEQNKGKNLAKFEETIGQYTDMLDWMEQNPNSPEAQYQFMQYFDPIRNPETGNVEGITGTSLLGKAMKDAGYDDKTIEEKLRALTIRIVTNPVYQSRVRELQ